MSSIFTIFFNGSFWVGVFQVEDPPGQLRAAQHVFGVEPTQSELLEFSRRDAIQLIERAYAAPPTPVSVNEFTTPRMNSKRLARQAIREQRQHGISTSSQAALTAEKEGAAKKRTVSARERRSADAEHRRSLKVAKRKAKHRGH